MARNLDILNSYTITEGPSSLQNRFEYNADGTVLYAGYAPRGAAASENVWVIFKYSYTSQQVVLKQTAYDTWDDRGTATYA